MNNDLSQEIYNAAVKSCIEQEELWAVRDTDIVRPYTAFSFQSKEAYLNNQIYIRGLNFRIMVAVWTSPKEYMYCRGKLFSKEYWALKRIYKRRLAKQEEKEYHNNLKKASAVIANTLKVKIGND